MPRFLKWLILALLLPLLLIGAMAVALQRWIGTDDFRTRLGERLSAELGVPVEIGGVNVDVWPLPAVAVEKVRIRTQPPLTVERIEARPVWGALVQRRLEIATLVVRQAVIPEVALAAIT